MPTSKKPNPNSPNESIKSPFLSKPAAVPSLFLKVIPKKLNSLFVGIFCENKLKRFNL